MKWELFMLKASKICLTKLIVNIMNVPFESQESPEAFVRCKAQGIVSRNRQFKKKRPTPAPPPAPAPRNAQLTPCKAMSSSQGQAECGTTAPGLKQQPKWGYDVYVYVYVYTCTCMYAE